MQTKDPTPFSPSSTDLSPQRRWEEVANLLMRGKWVILMMLLVVLTITALYTFLSEPVYEATSLVLVDSRGKDVGRPFLDIEGATTGTKITNELETLKARSTAEAVAETLLAMTYIDTTSKRFIPIIRAEVDGRFDDTTKEDLAVLTWRLQEAVRFSPIKESDIIWISARSHHPEEAALLVNTYTRVYVERNATASRVKSQALREFLQEQTQAKHESLDSIETALQSYMKTSGVVSLDAEATKVVNQLAQLEATRDGIEVDISTRTNALNSYKQELAEQEPNVAKAIGESNDTYIRLLQDQLAKLEVQRDVVIAQNPELVDEKIYSEKLKEIDNQVESLKKNLRARTKTFLASLIPGERRSTAVGGTVEFLAEVKQRIIEQQIELDALVARKAALGDVIMEYERRFNEIPSKNIGLAKLQRARLSNEKLYLLVEEKFNEAAITEKSEFGHLNILDTAVPPARPVSPKVGLNLALGVILGLFCGAGIVLLRARIDDRIRRPEDLKKYGIVPLATIGKIELKKKRNGRTSTPPGKDSFRVDQHLVAFLSPLSSISEGYRHLRTNVQFTQADRPVRTIMVTSPSPEEGKSTTVSNLAISFAQGENRVLLVDADMRRPRAHVLFGLDEQPGITDALLGKRKFEDVVHRSVMQNLDVLCCGTMPPNPAEILHSRRMREFVEYVGASYDVVLFDSPPLLAVTDAAILSRLVDAVLVVVCAERTDLASLDRVGEILQGVGKHPTGIVLNNLDVRRAYSGSFGRNRRDHYGYGYGYGYADNGRSSKKVS